MSKKFVGIFTLFVFLEQFFLFSFLPIDLLFFLATPIAMAALYVMINIFRSSPYSPISDDSNNVAALKDNNQQSSFSCSLHRLFSWGGPSQQENSKKRDTVIVEFCPDLDTSFDKDLAEQVAKSFQEYMEKNVDDYVVECSVGTPDVDIKYYKTLKIILLMDHRSLGRLERIPETDYLKYAAFGSYNHDTPIPNILTYEQGAFNPAHPVTQKTYEVFKNACELVDKPKKWQYCRV